MNSGKTDAAKGRNGVATSVILVNKVLLCAVMLCCSNAYRSIHNISCHTTKLSTTQGFVFVGTVKYTDYQTILFLCTLTH